ncbi:hypothetical protein PF002_g1881 [Phytophthora fragariae]|uniref:Uncharacterized protein n=1 Tax=Phytophthora fragariae TaxID=53985 RepID=A0A6A4ABI7_9STRA|nr:hypothetical protein PF002_g1881 [Phytophthora fragariae]
MDTLQLQFNHETTVFHKYRILKELATIPSLSVCVALTAVSLYISFLRSWVAKVLLEVTPLFEFFVRASVDAYVD